MILKIERDLQLKSHQKNTKVKGDIGVKKEATMTMKRVLFCQDTRTYSSKIKAGICHE